MPDHPIGFHCEDIEFDLEHPEQVREWITDIIQNHGYSVEILDYIFCSDEYLLQVNQEYLDHDTLTDIITFNNADDPDHAIEGDIFISIDRVRDNASSLQIPFIDEIHRVMIHGVLHLLGFDDKDPASQAAMRNKEDSCLSLRKF